MKSSPIYNIVNVSGKTKRRFGAVNGFTQDIRVGTSSSNSHTLAQISVERHVNSEDGSVDFCLFVDGVRIRHGILTGKQFELVTK